MHKLKYGDFQGKADVFDEGGSEIERGETTDLTTEGAVETNKAIYNAEIKQYLAGFLHRGNTASSPTKCRSRIRLTPSGFHKVGSVWYRDDVNILNGFDTYFTFQISDHSKECTVHKDQYFSQFHHRTCSVRGGDGFAFVMQRSPNTTAALGGDGGQMGFGGMENSVAIAFDIWQNPGDDRFGVDHVSVQSTGPNKANNAYDAGMLGVPRATALADGEVHLVRVTYYSELKAEYLQYLIASESLIPYLMDNGEQKRIGTLVVYVDEGVETGTPLMAMPINLSLLLDLPTDKAFVGFTSSTGRFFAKHDLLSWTFCEQHPCKKDHLLKFDYHQQSKFSAASGYRYEEQQLTSNNGRPEFPDTTPWQKPMEHFASGRQHGLAPNADAQVPPETLY
jgi:hypothetical protein